MRKRQHLSDLGRRRWQIAMLCALFVLLIVPSALGSDYLTPELRAAVEKLKADVAEAQTTKETVVERARVLWDWANAVAMSGGYLPVNLPSSMRGALNIKPGQEVPLWTLLGIDAYVRELAIKDENPRAIGTLSSSTKGPFPAASWQTIEITYTVGEMPLSPGGGILIGRHFMSSHGVIQRDDPAGDNYVSIRSSNPKAQFANATGPLGGMHGSFRGVGQMPVFKLESTALTKGETVTLTFGDTSGGGRGFFVQTYSNDAFPLPLYIDLGGKGQFLSLPIPTYEVVGTTVDAVHGFAPSIVKVGEAMDISVRSEDRYYNRATGEMPAYKVMLNGKRYRPIPTIPAGTEAITLFTGIRFDEPGIYRFSFQSKDGSIQGVSNPIWVKENPDWRVYWGETHGHCGFAEGQGTPDGFFTCGRDDARLDFLSLSEHDIWMDDYEWQFLKDAVSRYHVENKFVVFAGYEWTVRRQLGGHHNVFFRRPDGRKRVSSHRAPVLTELYRQLHLENDAEDVLIIPHAHQAGDWRTNDPDLERLVEIMSMHGTFEWFGRRYLLNGHQVGFLAAADDHLSHPGYVSPLPGGLFQRSGLAGVIAAEKTTDDIFDALRKRSVYATSGKRIILDVRMNDAGMGNRQPYTEKRSIHGKAIGTGPVDTITVVKNGEEIWTKRYALSTLKRRSWIHVGFESSSEVFVRDNPRGYRIWNGSLEVEGARLVGVPAPGFANPYGESFSVDPENKNRVTFNTRTRGRINAMILELKGADTDTRIHFKIKATREQGKSPRPVIKAAMLPAADVTFSFVDEKLNRIVRDFKVGRSTDRITLTIVDPEAPMVQDFEFTDTENLQHGDWYYVRVRQLDGALAWSSPWWVGGEPRQ